METAHTISQTAMLIASLRALSCYEEDACIRGNDTLAELFLPDDKRAFLQSETARSSIRQMIPTGLYEYVIARTAWFDRLMLHQLHKHTPQIVILGAGFDSRAVRFPSKLGNSVVFELDREATQNEKLRIFHENHVASPENVRYVPVNFEQETWSSSLIDAGFQSTIDSLIIWEGVTFYLTPQAVCNALHQLAELMNDSSILSFDYQHVDEKQALSETGIENETIRFGFNHRMIDSFLRSFELTLEEDMDSEKLTQQFLTLGTGQYFGAINPMMHIALVTRRTRR